MALKCSWIRRYLKEKSQYYMLVSIICPALDSIGKYGANFVQKKISEVSNPFWKDILQALYSIIYLRSPKSWEEFLSVPVFYNPNIKIGGKSFYSSNYTKKGIYFINDFLGENGNLYSFERFQQINNVQNTNFLFYNSIITSIRTYLNTLSIAHKSKKEKTPLQPLIAKVIFKQEKGCRVTYDLLIESGVKPTSQQKWTNILNLDNFNWKNVYILPFKCTKDSRLQWLQFRINHRILGTNNLRAKMGLINNNSCSFCKRPLV